MATECLEPTERWRHLAMRFHIISFMVRTGRLAPDFTPDELLRMASPTRTWSPSRSACRARPSA